MSRAFKCVVFRWFFKFIFPSFLSFQRYVIGINWITGYSWERWISRPTRIKGTDRCCDCVCKLSLKGERGESQPTQLAYASSRNLTTPAPSQTIVYNCPPGPKGDKGDKGDHGDQGREGRVGLTGLAGHKLSFFFFLSVSSNFYRCF